MSKSNTFENQILAAALNGVALPAPSDGNLYLSLHTADPGEAGTQATSECAYTGYARVAVARDGTGWTVENGTATLASDKAFPQATAGSETATHLAIGMSSSGAGDILYFGALQDSISITANSTPTATTGTTVSEE